MNNTTLSWNYKEGIRLRIKKGCPGAGGSLVNANAAYFINGTMRRATMLMTLIIGLMAGPAVSL